MTENEVGSADYFYAEVFPMLVYHTAAEAETKGLQRGSQEQLRYVWTRMTDMGFPLPPLGEGGPDLLFDQEDETPNPTDERILHE